MSSSSSHSHSSSRSHSSSHSHSHSSSISNPATPPTGTAPPAKPGSPDRECGGCGSGGQAKAKAPKQCSPSPVYYYNGEVSLQDGDLPGPVAGFGHTRCYSNRLAPGGTAGLFAGPNGNNILNPSLPFIVKDGTDFVLMMGQRRVWFNSSFVAQYGADDTYAMRHESVDKLWVVDIKTGRGVTTYAFQDDAGGNTNPEGLFYRRVDAYGNETKVETYSTDWIEEVRYKSASGGDTAYSILYTFYGVGDHTDRIKTATLRYTADDTAGTITWEDIRRASYTYYGANESHGSRNDLKLVTQQAPAPGSGGTWDDAAKSYYRWYKDGDEYGFEGALKYAVGPQAYAELVLDGQTPETASDGVIGDAAEHYFEYDAGTREVTKEIARDCAGCGGGGTGDSGETFTRTTATHSGGDGYNSWATKTVMTKANGNVVTVYSNYLGQVMLRELKETSSSSRKWISYTKYGTSGGETGKVVESATPAAVSTYNDTNADLGVTLHSGAGLITVYAYGSSTTANGNTLGDVTGYLKTTSIKEGSSGSEVKQREVQYKSSTNTSGEKAYVTGKETRYQDEASGGSDPVATEYEYTWHSSPHETAIETVVTKLPTVSTGQNGDGVQYYTRRKLDTSGRVVMRLDERNILTTMAYNHTTGRMTQQVVDAAKPGKGYPSGWPDPVTGNEAVTTTYSYDSLGRQTEVLGEAHDADLGGSGGEEVQHATWTVYKEAVTGDQVWTGRGYHTPGSGSDTLVNPVSIALNDKRGRTTDSIQSKRSTGSGKLSSSDTFLRADWSRWTVSLYTTKGQLQYQRVYHTIPPQTPTDEGLAGVTQDPGVQGTNYEETHHLYADETNLRIKSISPDETISRTVYDPINRVESQWIGTDDTGATASDPTGGGSGGNNMVKVSENTYDAGAAGGNSYLTNVEQFVDGSDTRETSYTYDFRGRRTVTDGEETLYSESTYDNLNRVTKVEQKDTTSGGNLTGRQETFYDDRGRVYRTKVYGVDPDTGTVGEHLVGNNFYDGAGNLTKSIAPGSGLSWTQTEYDHLGRPSRSYTGYDDNAAPDDEVVVEESIPTYNKVGQVLETQRKQRDTGSSIASPTFRSLYTAGWYDGIGRSIGSANYGTNGGTAPTRPGTVPVSSNTVLVSTTTYNDAGEAFSTTDPEGIETRRVFDQMGRVTEQIDNYQPPGSSGGASGPDVNRTTEYTYTADSQQKTVTAKMTSASDDEVTTYVYGVDSTKGSDFAANNVLYAIQYPTDTTSKRIELKYNRLGQVTERKDQNGTTHQYTYDGLGRPTADTASTIPAGIDDAVKRLTTAYNTRGQAQTLTSHSNTSGSGGEVNQVEFEYNDFGQLTSDWQEHDGTVTTSGGSASLRMQYQYTNASGTPGSAAANRIRLNTWTYPNGKEFKHGYGGENGVDDAINRPTNIREESSGGGGGFQTVANYRYLGAGRVVVVNDVEAGLKLDQWGNTPGSYTGLDNFNRSVGFRWEDTAPSPDVAVADLAYGYDRDSLPTYREDLQAQANSQDYDELYVRDGLNRLDDYQRGELNAGHTAMMTTTFRQTWSLDQVANWTEFKQDDGDGSGGWDLDQDRTHNKVNEITAITGGGWNAPSYDSAGNTTQAPSPGAPGTGTSDLKCTYDAWNRLVKVTDNAGTPTTLAEHGYDARGFRITKKEYSAGSHDSTRDYYYTSRWQCVEERVTDESTSTTTLDRQYIWGLRYIDDLVRRDRDTTGNGTLDETLYALTDRQYNVIGLWDPNASGGAKVVERVCYDPYGLPQFLNEDFSTKSNSSYDWTTLFQGLHRDGDTGLYYNRARELHPLLGRFMQRDPLGYPDGLNTYAAYHVMRNRWDPIGRDMVTPDGVEEGEDWWPGPNGTGRRVFVWSISIPNEDCPENTYPAYGTSISWNITNVKHGLQTSGDYSVTLKDAHAINPLHIMLGGGPGRDWGNAPDIYMLGYLDSLGLDDVDQLTMEQRRGFRAYMDEQNARARTEREAVGSTGTFAYRITKYCMCYDLDWEAPLPQDAIESRGGTESLTETQDPPRLSVGSDFGPRSYSPWVLSNPPPNVISIAGETEGGFDFDFSGDEPIGPNVHGD